MPVAKASRSSHDAKIPLPSWLLKLKHLAREAEAERPRRADPDSI